MTESRIIISKKRGILKISINRPEAMNSLTPDLITELTDAVTAAGKDDEIGVIIITGIGKAFCAGVDLKSLGSIETADVGKDLNNAARHLQKTIEDVPGIVIAMINGYCLTGGLELALACDLAVAADEAGIGDTHVKWGLRCTWGMSQRLPFRVGELKAREMTYTAEMIDGREAERIGLVNKSVPLSELEKTVDQLAAKILANSRDAVAAHKALYNRNKQELMQKGLEREYSTMPDISDTQERILGFKK